MEEYGGSSMVINGEKGRGVIIRRSGVELHKWIRGVIHRITCLVTRSEVS